MEAVLVGYLKDLGVPVSKKYFEKICRSHSDYPSLLSISDTLEKFGIPCQIGRIEEQHLSKVEFPFLIQMENSGELVQINMSADLEKSELDLSEWDGIIIKAEQINEIKDSDHNAAYQKERLIKKLASVLVISLIGLMLIPLIQTFSWINLGLFTTATLGFSLGYLLIAKDLGITYAPVESFCNVTTLANCDSILSSEGAKIFSFFSLTDAVFTYFSFQLVAIGILIPFSTNVSPYLTILMAGSLLSIPVIFYSIYYQKVVAKTWCKLCMLVNAVLLTQAIFLSVLFLKGEISVQITELIPFIISFLWLSIVAVSVVLIKDKFLASNDSLNAEISASRLKNDPEVFASLLVQNQKIDTGNFEKKIMIGNPDAKLQLIMVASLHCYPCKLAFDSISELVKEFPNKIGVEFRFTLSPGKMVHNIPANIFLIQYWERTIFGEKNEYQKTIDLISSWYKTMDAAEFEKIYHNNASVQINKEEGLGNDHLKWILRQGITHTPTFFLNGYQYPSKFRISDLENVMPGLETSIKEQIENRENELVN